MATERVLYYGPLYTGLTLTDSDDIPFPSVCGQTERAVYYVPLFTGWTLTDIDDIPFPSFGVSQPERVVYYVSLYTGRTLPDIDDTSHSQVLWSASQKECCTMCHCTQDRH
ncbi:hypothetical protein ACOMHN_065701 [Nucella lapillus]